MAQLELTDTDNGRTFTLDVGTEIHLSLEENPTTGFQWSIETYNREILSLEESDFDTIPGVGIGGGGTRTFTFRSQRSGETDLILKSWREWEGDSSVIQRYSFKIKIR